MVTRGAINPGITTFLGKWSLIFFQILFSLPPNSHAQALRFFLDVRSRFAEFRRSCGSAGSLCDGADSVRSRCDGADSVRSRFDGADSVSVHVATVRIP
jgi:hypothetical protein